MRTLWLLFCCLPLIYGVNAQDHDYFWHLTDFHLDTSYWKNPRNARNASEFFSGGMYNIPVCWVEGGGIFGDYNCDAPLVLIQSAIKFVQEKSAELEKMPKFVIWTGDDSVHSDNSHFSEDIVLDLIAQNTQLILPLFSESGIKIFPVLGNHDAFPKNHFSPQPVDGDFYSKVADIWKDLIPDKAEDFKTLGGYYFLNKTETGLPFHVLALNTNIYYKNDDLVDPTDPDPLKQFNWAKGILDGISADNETVLVFGHISPGKFERYYSLPGYHWFRPEYNEKFIDELILPYQDIITAQFYGHHHTDTFKMFSDDEGFASVAFLSPAVTPWRSTLAPETGANNPGLRLVQYDSHSGEILDIVTFWLNLKEANAKGVAEWSELYSFKDAYGLVDFRAESLGELAQKLKPGIDDSTYELYFKYNSVHYDEHLERNCTIDCQATQYCSILTQRYDEFEACQAEQILLFEN